MLIGIVKKDANMAAHYAAKLASPSNAARL
jgi:hypothetical protein